MAKTTGDCGGHPYVPQLGDKTVENIGDFRDTRLVARSFVATSASAAHMGGRGTDGHGYDAERLYTPLLRGRPIDSPAECFSVRGEQPPEVTRP